MTSRLLTIWSTILCRRTNNLHNPVVLCIIPEVNTYAGVAQLLERFLAMEEVQG